ncbi:MAG TPA: cytochrome c [Candidatus Eisenbacteria bacterium]
MKRFLLQFVAVVLGVFLFTVVARAEEAKVPKGQDVFLKYHCNSCHTVKAEKIEKRKVEGEEEEGAAPATEAKTAKKEPPDLSDVGLKQKPEWMEGWIMRKEMLDGKKHMKRYRGTPDELKDLVAWLSTLKTEDKAAKKEEAPAK